MRSFDCFIFPLAFPIPWDQQKVKATKAELMWCFPLPHCLNAQQGLSGGESSVCYPLVGILELPEIVKL